MKWVPLEAFAVAHVHSEFSALPYPAVCGRSSSRKRPTASRLFPLQRIQSGNRSLDVYNWIYSCSEQMREAVGRRRQEERPHTAGYGGTENPEWT